jgi:hypothetical protein
VLIWERKREEKGGIEGERRERKRVLGGFKA